MNPCLNLTKWGFNTRTDPADAYTLHEAERECNHGVGYDGSAEETSRYMVLLPTCSN